MSQQGEASFTNPQNLSLSPWGQVVEKKNSVVNVVFQISAHGHTQISSVFFSLIWNKITSHCGFKSCYWRMSGLWWETHAFQNRADQDSRAQHELLVYIPCFTVVCEPEKSNMEKLIPRPIQTCPDSLLGERGNTHSWRRGRTTVLPSVWALCIRVYRYGSREYLVCSTLLEYSSKAEFQATGSCL